MYPREYVTLLIALFMLLNTCIDSISRKGTLQVYTIVVSLAQSKLNFCGTRTHKVSTTLQPSLWFWNVVFLIKIIYYGRYCGLVLTPDAAQNAVTTCCYQKINRTP